MNYAKHSHSQTSAIIDKKMNDALPCAQTKIVGEKRMGFV